ncbi:transposase [Candidatus Gottesmanbacteria bacterium]|nr:transposase [Candidatus Gottesmanbacteria bacterium]
MGKHNRYTSKQKLEIVLEGIRGETTITELCRKYGIGSNMYYKWRDLFVRKGEEIFANRGNFASEQVYVDRIREMERVIGRLAMENEILKKAESILSRI